MNKLTDAPRTDAAKPKLTRESYDKDWNLKTENDTPRTDEQIWTTCFDHRSCDVVDMEFARQLERELAQSLENQVKSQAEVERLNGQLKRAIEIADEFWNNQKQAVLMHHQELAPELEQLKELEKSKSEML